MLHILTGVMLLRQTIRCFALAQCFTVQFCISVISQIIVAIAADLFFSDFSGTFSSSENGSFERGQQKTKRRKWRSDPGH